VTGHQPTLVDTVLECVEGFPEIGRISHCGHLVANTIKRLGKGGTAQLERIEREINVVYWPFGVVDQDRCQHLLDIRHFGPCRYDDGAR